MSMFLPAHLSSTRKRTPATIALFVTLLLSVGAAWPTANALISAGGFDGPAALPRVLLQTAMANTPAPGITISVKSGESLQAVLNNVKCGDTILLESGATFTGVFTFPNKGCDDAHWIIVRTSSDNSQLPAEGSRLTPCYAGVSSLPGRPALNCTSVRNVLAKLVMNRRYSSGPVIFASGASHYRLIGLEITRTAGGGLVYALASPVGGSITRKIIYDRLWVHGTAHDETARGVQLGGSSYVSVIDSFFTDFHCVSGMSCSDSQAINGGLGNHPMGPYKIVNNFLEASGENILFGGGAATYTPADIEIRRNHMFKPLTWMKGKAGYVGGVNGSPFIVKNLIELKNAQRVLLDGNIMEYVWGGFTQVGYAVVLTPKNQGGKCGICKVTDITLRNGTISHMAGGMLLGNGPSDTGALPSDGGRYSIHDVVFDDIDGVKYHGPDLFVQMSTGKGAPVLHDIKVNHVTAFPSGTSFLIGDVVSLSGAMSNLVVSNSIVLAGNYPVWSTGTGGTSNCAVHDSPLSTLNACFSSYVFAGNVLIATPSNYPTSSWPAHNHFAATVTAVQFMNYNNGSAGNYALLATSPYKGAAMDGKDIGADVTTIQTALARVR
jgi:hypothetical protein